MTALFAAALRIQRICDANGWASCVIGGIAVLRWGEARFTRDVDLTLLTGFGNEGRYIDTLLQSGYRGRIADAAAFALRSRVLLLESPEEVPIDVALGGLPFEYLAVERATWFEYEPGCVLRTCSAEDLLVQKLFAFRPRDLNDAETICAKQAGVLDWKYIETQLSPLAELKEQPEIMAQLAKMRG